MKIKSPSQIIAEARHRKSHLILGGDALQLLEGYGLPLAKFEVASGEEEAVVSAKRLGYPVALKAISPDLPHKTEAGGVLLGVRDESQLKSGYHRLLENIKRVRPDARIEGLLVQEMAPPSTELAVGLVEDKQFGPTVMFGLGGVFVETLKDVSFRLCPLSEGDAQEMISEIRGYPLLRGVRGQPPADIDAVVRILLAVSKIAEDHPEIGEMDLNPVFVYEKGAKVVDARIALKPSLNP